MATKYPDFNWKAKNLVEEFKLFKQQIELCLLDNGVTDDEKISTKIQIALGKEGLKKLNASSLTEEDKKRPRKIMEPIRVPTKNKCKFQNSQNGIDDL